MGLPRSHATAVGNGRFHGQVFPYTAGISATRSSKLAAVKASAYWRSSGSHSSLGYKTYTSRKIYSNTSRRCRSA